MLSLDSDLLIEFLRGNKSAIKFVKSLKGPIHTTVLNVQEVLVGCMDSPKQKKRAQAFLSLLNIEPYQPEAVDKVVSISWTLYRNGTPIGRADEIIAGICINKELTIVTRNTKHFKKVKGLKIKSW